VHEIVIRDMVDDVADPQLADGRMHSAAPELRRRDRPQERDGLSAAVLELAQEFIERAGAVGRDLHEVVGNVWDGGAVGTEDGFDAADDRRPLSHRKVRDDIARRPPFASRNRDELVRERHQQLPHHGRRRGEDGDGTTDE
jgi:hypothetical protein